MNPFVMGLLLVIAAGAFAYTAQRRWRLMLIGPPESRFDRLRQRLRLTFRHAFGQERLTRYRLAGWAHKAIFFGFLVLLLRSLILFGRGFVSDPGFGYGVFDGGTVLGNLYALVKDVYVLLVILGTVVFLYYRIIVKLPRLKRTGEGILILAMILALMVADITYDGAGHVVAARVGVPGESPLSFNAWQPLGSGLAMAINPLPDSAVTAVWHLGFWTHVGLVLIFLNLLPYSKHFHIITAVPNVFFQNLGPAGRLRPLEDLEGMVERAETLGLRRIDQLSWKGILDLYSCTECGRCTDQCPASQTGKLLSPQQLTVDLREFLYRHEPALTADAAVGASQPSCESDVTEGGASAQHPHRSDLVPNVIRPEVLWACTTCGACEQECPVFISYVDKIVDMRRYLVQEKGEVAASLQATFQNLETTGSPYGVAGDQRLQWADGLEVPRRADATEAEILFWVGCAAATDERAKGIARAVAQLLNVAGVKWAVLGEEERCTGDVARRAGNEFLFQMMARSNVETLNRYGTKRILTACPHCYNTLKNEYPDFGGDYEVVHHTDFLGRLVAEGRLKPKHPVNTRVAYHDSCYLGRYNGIYDSPRAVLASIPGVELVEPTATRDRGMCCGAGGAQMFKEEEDGRERVSTARTRQLLETGADAISSACPFCMRMLTDALDGAERTGIEQLDIAEILWKSVADREPTAVGIASTSRRS